MNVYDEQGRPVQIGTVVGRGGEAIVYQVIGQPGWLAKIYEPAPRSNYPAKLAWMIDYPPDNPTGELDHPSFAWPSALLGDAQGRLMGYLMPHIRQAVPILTVFNPRRRAEILPQFDRRYLYRVARNLAAALGALHSRGYVVGDLNESNILVTPSALVTLIDTDSFQVREPRGERTYTHYCPVAKIEYTPPELQGIPLAKVIRSPEQDAFSLGILIFQLLMEGNHPFRAQWLGPGDPPPIEERIRIGGFPYTAAPACPVRPPRHAPDLSLLQPELAEMVRRCFVDGHADPSLRPDPAAWERAIAQAEKSLVACPHGHYYPDHLRACPFCPPPQAQPAPAAHPVRPEPAPPVPAAARSNPAPAAHPGPARPQPAASTQPGPANAAAPAASGPAQAAPGQGQASAAGYAQAAPGQPVRPNTPPAAGPAAPARPSAWTTPARPSTPPPAARSRPNWPGQAFRQARRAYQTWSAWQAQRTPAAASSGPAPAAAPGPQPAHGYGRPPAPAYSPRSVPTPHSLPRLWDWLGPRLGKSLAIGGGLGALAGALPGAVAGAVSGSAGNTLAWGLLWALGGAAGGMLRGWQPGYRLSLNVNRTVGWQRVWTVFGLILGGGLGGLIGLALGWWAIFPIFAGLYFGAKFGLTAGRKLWEVGEQVGWERIWSWVGAGGAALAGWTLAQWVSASSLGSLSSQLAASLTAWISAQSSSQTLVWLAVGALGGSLGGAIAGISADLLARLSGLVD